MVLYCLTLYVTNLVFDASIGLDLDLTDDLDLLVSFGDSVYRKELEAIVYEAIKAGMSTMRATVRFKADLNGGSDGDPLWESRLTMNHNATGLSLGQVDPYVFDLLEA